MNRMRIYMLPNGLSLSSKINGSILKNERKIQEGHEAAQATQIIKSKTKISIKKARKIQRSIDGKSHCKTKSVKSQKLGILIKIGIKAHWQEDQDHRDLKSLLKCSIKQSLFGLITNAQITLLQAMTSCKTIIGSKIKD